MRQAARTFTDPEQPEAELVLVLESPVDAERYHRIALRAGELMAEHWPDRLAFACAILEGLQPQPPVYNFTELRKLSEVLPSAFWAAVYWGCDILAESRCAALN